ncbi:hypothetical protein EYF80_032319 [Liparis tanakae]|uniref:Uncharacterized protein n=1 Tax=Liparis tanakae TaxID=230148 RepID=A0A4Z2GWM5_9TELE|nr:hypothetical protein EYF80_032319 [Liparis tanakae]
MLSGDLMSKRGVFGSLPRRRGGDSSGCIEVRMKERIHTLTMRLEKRRLAEVEIRAKTTTLLLLASTTRSEPCGAPRWLHSDQEACELQNCLQTKHRTSITSMSTWRGTGSHLGPQHTRPVGVQHRTLVWTPQARLQKNRDGTPVISRLLFRGTENVLGSHLDGEAEASAALTSDLQHHALLLAVRFVQNRSRRETPLVQNQREPNR